MIRAGILRQVESVLVAVAIALVVLALLVFVSECGAGIHVRLEVGGPQ